VIQVPDKGPPGEKGISVVATSSGSRREGKGWLLEGVDGGLIVGKSANVGGGTRKSTGGRGDA
jgi:hypothetical protein